MAIVMANQQSTVATGQQLFPSDIRVQTVDPQWSSQLIEITPELASYWINHCRYPGQRHLREQHVQRLVRALKEGKLDKSELTFYDYGQGPMCLNGMHRLNAIVRAEVPLWANVVWHSEATPAEAEAAYRRFDQGLPRNFGDVLRASHVAEAIEITLGNATQISSAAMLIGTGFDANRQHSDYVYYRDYDHRLQLTQDWLAAGEQYLAIVKGSRKWLRRALHTRAVMAVGLVCCRDQLDQAELFWGKVAENSGLERRDPAHSLVTYLGIAYHSATQVNRHSRAVASCWNAHFEDRTISQPRVDDPNAAIRIAGTRFERGHEPWDRDDRPRPETEAIPA